jgi:ribosomal protein S27AE
VSDPAEGGDPVCWLNRVCPECGLLTDEEPPLTCPRCGATIPAPDEPGTTPP